MTEVLRSGDNGWDSARTPWNLAFDQQPAMVALPKNVDEVAEVVRTAKDAGLRLAVQAAGHAAGALGPVGDDTLLMKTLHMTGAEVDTAGRRARVSAAAKWHDVAPQASAEGLSPLLGSVARGRHGGLHPR